MVGALGLNRRPLDTHGVTDLEPNAGSLLMTVSPVVLVTGLLNRQLTQQLRFPIPPSGDDGYRWQEVRRTLTADVQDRLINLLSKFGCQH